MTHPTFSETLVTFGMKDSGHKNKPFRFLFSFYCELQSVSYINLSFKQITHISLINPNYTQFSKKKSLKMLTLELMPHKIHHKNIKDQKGFLNHKNSDNDNMTCPIFEG